LADPLTYEVDIIQRDEQPLALIVYSRAASDILEIPILRIVSDPLASTLAMHLINAAVILCTQEGRILTRLTEPHISDPISTALQENEFVQNNDCWVKANLPVVEDVENLEVRLTKLMQHFPNVSDYLRKLLDAMQLSVLGGNLQTLLQVEKSLWPAKIIDLDIPVYVVSIQPQWAMNLFDLDIANQTLFGADPFLMLNLENVYYRSSRTDLNAPGRILWYVNKGKGYQGTMSIRACSYLEEVIVGSPKTLFSRFERLGIYAWKDVYDVAKRNVDQEIMAFRFSKTEVFKKPIHRSDLQAIWAETRGRNFNIQGPLSISNDLFMRIYKTGGNG
jgi:hypothetical protein